MEYPPLLEAWYREFLPIATTDISSSGVSPYTLDELLDLTGLELGELGSVVLDDSVSYGAPRLRRAIAARYGGGEGERVIATHGSSEAISLLLTAALGPGDRVIVFGPIYHSLGHFPAALGSFVEQVPLAYLVGAAPGDIPAIVPEQTDAVILNSPHNPTGAVVPPATAAALAARCDAIGATFIWDAAMAELDQGRSAIIPVPSRSITFGTLSKAFGLPGLRVGWALAEPTLLERTLAHRDRTTLFLSPLVEVLAAAAVEHADALIGPRLAQATHNLALVDAWVADDDRLRWCRPEGGVCGLVHIHDVGDVARFCRDLLSATGVLLVPGTAFGVEGAVRLGFGGRTADLERGLAAFGDALPSTRR